MRVARQAEPRRRHAASTGSTAAPSQSAPTSRVERRRALRRARRPTTTSCSGTVTGTTPGDSVKVWFTGGGADERLVHLHASSPRPASRVLVLSAEDYTGASPATAGRDGAAVPLVLQRRAGRERHRLRRVRRRRPRPHGADHLGVLSHYNAVVWYTGDDIITREPGWGPGNASRLAMQEMLRCATTSTRAGACSTPASTPGTQYTTALGTQLYDPFENAQCRADPAIKARCLPLAGSGDSQGDPIEYYVRRRPITTAARRPGPGQRGPVRRRRGSRIR